MLWRWWRRRLLLLLLLLLWLIIINAGIAIVTGGVMAGSLG